MHELGVKDAELPATFTEDTKLQNAKAKKRIQTAKTAQRLKKKEKQMKKHQALGEQQLDDEEEVEERFFSDSDCSSNYSD